MRVLPQEWTRDVAVLETLPEAVLVNAGVKGYCRTIIDSMSLSFFLESLSLIKDDLNRSYVWRTLWENLKLGNVTGFQVLDCFLKHFPEETEEYTMTFTLQMIQHILKYRIDPEDKLTFLPLLRDLFLRKIEHCCSTKSMEVLLFQELVSMFQANDKQDFLTAFRWLGSSKATISETKVITLDKLQRY